MVTLASILIAYDKSEKAAEAELRKGAEEDEDEEQFKRLRATETTYSLGRASGVVNLCDG
jgi:hypothetical protein